MLYCRYCGATLPDDARFCHICGKEVDRTPHCPSCGASLPEGSRFCSFCGTPLSATASAPAPAVPTQPAAQPEHLPVQPVMTPLGSGNTIHIPAPPVTPPPAPIPVDPPSSAPLEGVLVPPIINRWAFNGSVHRFFGENGAHYSFQGPGMYGFLEPFSMNYSAGQGPLTKAGGKWYYHTASDAEGIEVPALSGAQILTASSDGMYVYLAPYIYFVSPDGSMRPFIEAAETLTDMVCYRNWLFVTYLGPFEDLPQANGSILCCDRSYVIAYDRGSGDAAAIFERCAGVYYIDEQIIILCDLMDNGEISRNVYRAPVRHWTEDGFKAVANYVGRIRGSITFSKLILDTCGNNGLWKNATECTTNLRCCDWHQKLLAYQQGNVVVWRDFSGKPSSTSPTL